MVSDNGNGFRGKISQREARDEHDAEEEQNDAKGVQNWRSGIIQTFHSDITRAETNCKFRLRPLTGVQYTPGHPRSA